MTKDDFVNRTLAMRETLYRVSFSILPNHADQDDAVQECIKKALTKRESLKQDSFFNTWITRILINECYQIKRKRKKEVLFEEIHANLPETANFELADAVMSLDTGLRTLVVLFYIEGYSIKETSRIMKMPEGTVKWKLSRARTLLRNHLDDGRDKA